MSDVVSDTITLRGAKDRGVLPLLVPFARAHLKRPFGFPKKVSQRVITNTLNHLHFTGATIYAHMAFPSTGQEFLVSVQPEPCTGRIFSARFPHSVSYDFSLFSFKELLHDDGQYVLSIPGKVVDQTKDILKIELPPSGIVLNTRQARRFQSSFIQAMLIWGSLNMPGALEDFSSSGLRIKVSGNTEGIRAAFESKERIQIILIKGSTLVYTGFGFISRFSEKEGAIVVTPSLQPLTRYAQRRYRHQRINITPTPRVELFHPLLNRTVSYDVIDLHTAGFSIKDRSDRLMFLPGMSFPNASMVFSGEFSIRFSAQTVYSRDLRGGMTRLGFSITDMDPASYRRLFNILTRAEDPHSLALGKVSTEALWQFFFRSGFVYPEKYLCIARRKEHFQKMYDHLYNNCPELFASITYQQNDEIYGHVSLFKAYPRTWWVQHLAALPMGNRRTGLNVLNNILNFLDGFHRMSSAGMDYLVFNYRPDNRFPNHFFGGVCRALNDPRMCSVDISAYVMHHLPETIDPLPAGWEIRPCMHDDIGALHGAYHNHSQGLFIESLCLDDRDESIWNTYRNHGLTRSCSAYVLDKDGDRKAFFVVERSDQGLNLSDLLNSIRIFLPRKEPKSMPWDILRTAIGHLAHEFGAPDVVLQVFPQDYCSAAGIPVKKRYCTWIAKTRYFDPHFDAIKEMTRFNHLKFLKSLALDLLGLRRRP